MMIQPLLKDDDIRSFMYLLVFATLLGAELLPASDISLSIREVCRRRVAGEYLNIYDSKVRLKGLIDKHRMQIKGVKEAVRVAEKEVELAAEKLEKDYFNTQLAYMVRVAKSKLDTNQSLLKDLNSSLESLLEKYKKESTKVSIVKSRIKGVFVLAEVKQTHLGYPFQLTYSRKCPKFQDGCSLKQPERKALQRLFDAEAIARIPVCEKYMNQGVYDSNRD